MAEKRTERKFNGESHHDRKYGVRELIIRVTNVMEMFEEVVTLRLLSLAKHSRDATNKASDRHLTIDGSASPGGCSY